MSELAVLLRTVLAKIHRVVEDSSYNYFVHTSPWTAATWDHYHWHLEIIPRTTGIGGFEWGVGLYINAMPPEEAVRRMREAPEP